MACGEEELYKIIQKLITFYVYMSRPYWEGY